MDKSNVTTLVPKDKKENKNNLSDSLSCLLYTSDAADEVIV